MTNKFATVLCACLIAIAVMAHAVRAEEYEDVPVDPPIETVEETPAPEDPVSDAQGPARVPVEIDPDALAAALTQALASPTPDPDAEPTPEPTPQIIVIHATPETAPTPEPTEAPTIWDKPFNDYTPTEGLLLLTFVALCFLALLIWLR